MLEVQLFGPVQISNAPPATTAGLGPGLGETALGRGGPEAPARFDAGSAPNFLQLSNPGNLRLQPGMTMRGQVMGTEGNNVTLRFGDATLTATTGLPLTEGQHVDVQVTGQQQGKWNLQLLGSQLFTAMSEEDVTSTLMQMNLPTSEGNVEVAKTMVAMGLPLRGEDLQELVRNLAQLPREATPQDVMSAVFLKAGSLPLTSTNLQTLATFITEHPFIGAQLMGVGGSLRRLLDDPKSRASMSESLIEMLEETPGLLGEYVLDPLKLSGRKMQQRLHDMAFQAGIESMGPHGGDDFDMQEWLKRLREQLYRQGELTAEMGVAAGMFGQLEDNLTATRLMNAAAGAEQGSFYFQVPMKPRHDTAEARLIYHVDGQGAPLLDPENAVIELVIPTENLGLVSYMIVIRNGCVALDAAVDSEEAFRVLEGSLPTLMARLEALGYDLTPATCRPRAKTEQAAMAPVSAPELESLERVDIQW
jgi:hypothetical protein